MIRKDNDRGNILTELKEFFFSNSTFIEHSAAYAPERNGMTERLVQNTVLEL